MFPMEALKKKRFHERAVLLDLEVVIKILYDRLKLLSIPWLTKAEEMLSAIGQSSK